MDDVVFNFKMYGHDDENSFVVILVIINVVNFQFNICSFVCTMDCYIAFEVYTPTFYKNIDIFFYQGAIGELQVNIPAQLLHSGKKKKKCRHSKKFL